VVFYGKILPWHKNRIFIICYNLLSPVIKFFSGLFSDIAGISVLCTYCPSWERIGIRFSFALFHIVDAIRLADIVKPLSTMERPEFDKAILS